MRKRKVARRSRHLTRKPDEQALPVAAPEAAERLGPHYAAGPALRLASDRAPVPSSIAIEPPTPIPAAQGSGVPERVSAYQHGPLRLEGRTDATYDGGSYSTERVRTARAGGCDGCEASDCVHVTGILVASYHVGTNVTLPGVGDYPDLTPCQRRRVQNAITNVLAPHEQQHVQAFRQYNGTTSTPFDLTLCRGDFDARIQSMFEAQERARRAAAQAASDALDPFHFDVDLNCSEPTPRGTMTGEAMAETPPNDNLERTDVGG